MNIFRHRGEDTKDSYSDVGSAHLESFSTDIIDNMSTSKNPPTDPHPAQA